MKVLSKKTICEMGEKEIQRYCINLEKALKKKGWYEKSKNGTLNEEEQKAFDRIMEQFRWIRINCD